MKVVDAGAVVELVIGAVVPERLGADELAVPHLVDSEVTNALRRLVLHGHLTDAQGRDALADFVDLELTRHPVEALRRRMWQLRHDVTAHQATYVTAEPVALVSTDARLSKVPGLCCTVELL